MSLSSIKTVKDISFSVPAQIQNTEDFVPLDWIIRRSETLTASICSFLPEPIKLELFEAIKTEGTRQLEIWQSFLPKIDNSEDPSNQEKIDIRCILDRLQLPTTTKNRANKRRFSLF
jgi:hypothetical protein